MSGIEHELKKILQGQCPVRNIKKNLEKTNQGDLNPDIIIESIEILKLHEQEIRSLRQSLELVNKPELVEKTLVERSRVFYDYLVEITPIFSIYLTSIKSRLSTIKLTPLNMKIFDFSKFDNIWIKLGALNLVIFLVMLIINAFVTSFAFLSLSGACFIKYYSTKNPEYITSRIFARFN